VLSASAWFARGPANNCSRKIHEQSGVGAFAWGSVTIALAAIVLWIVGYAGWHICGVANDKSYVFDGDISKHIIGLFYALKENGSLVAGVLGFSGLAWSHFYKTPTAAPETKQSSGEDQDHD